MLLMHVIGFQSLCKGMGPTMGLGRSALSNHATICLKLDYVSIFVIRAEAV